MKKIIFHTPIDIFHEDTSGDTVRPRKMYEAFCSLGYEVILCHGDSKSRRKSFKEITKGNTSGIIGVYSELSSRSLYLTDPDRIPRSLFLDFSYLKELKKRGLPISFFYRDIHWLFRDESSKSKKSWTKPITYLFHMLELWQVKKLSSVFFLPSLRMLNELPIKPKNSKALPPAGSPPESLELAKESDASRSKLRLFYVGGCTPPLYDLSIILNTVRKVPECELILCTRKGEWENQTYNLPDNVKLIHESGKTMLKELKLSDALIMYYPKNNYREFAVPVKLFEAACLGIPVISDSHGETAEIIEREKIGWTAKNPDELESLIKTLSANKEKISEAKKSTSISSHKNSWRARAETVLSELKGR